MEVYGRKIRQSLYQGSDDVHDFPCSPCAKEGKNVAAAKHCVECDENMCSTCLDQHNKFSSMKGHQLLDKAKTPSGQRPELPSQRCDKHGGKLIDVYCPGHDKVGCSTCIAVEHISCQAISFIPDIAKHSKSSEELQQLEIAISSLQSRFLALKQKKQVDLDILKQEKDQLQQEIRSERKKINDELDKMEKELLSEVDATFQIKMQNIDSSIKEVEETLASLKDDQHNIQAAKNENVSEKYVQVKLGHERKKISKDRLENIERSSKKGRLWFDPYNETTSKNNIIGRVINYSAVEIGSFIGEFDARHDNDNVVCEIYGMCLCADENIVFADYNNKRIKKMNESYSVTSSLTVNDNPYSICQVGESLLAVTLINTMKVQFVSQSEPMTLQKSFNVGDRCRGIAYKDGLIYVCCGGSRKRKEEGTGHVEVFTIPGALITSYFGELQCPGYVTVTNWTTEIFIGDGNGGLLIIDRDKNVTKSTAIDSNMHGSAGICWINRSQLCIAGWKSKKLMLVACDGKVHEEFMTERDGISTALGVCFDEKRSRLVVSTHEYNQIKVYNLSISNC